MREKMINSMYMCSSYHTNLGVLFVQHILTRPNHNSTRISPWFTDSDHSVGLKQNSQEFYHPNPNISKITKQHEAIFWRSRSLNNRPFHQLWDLGVSEGGKNHPVPSKVWRSQLPKSLPFCSKGPGHHWENHQQLRVCSICWAKGRGRHEGIGGHTGALEHFVVIACEGTSFLLPRVISVVAPNYL